MRKGGREGGLHPTFLMVKLPSGVEKTVPDT